MTSERPERPFGFEDREEEEPTPSAMPPEVRHSIPPRAVSQPVSQPPPRRSSAPPSEPPPFNETYPPPLDGADSKDAGRRGRFESLLPGVIRRGIERGIEAGLNTFEKSLETGRGTTDVMREVLSEVKIPRDVASSVVKALQETKLPRELASAVFNQIDETKNDALRIVAKEVRDFLEATDLANEIKGALTSLSFEVRTEVRFIPNDAGAGVKPQVRSRTRVKRATEPAPRDRKRRSEAADLADEESSDARSSRS